MIVPQPTAQYGQVERVSEARAILRARISRVRLHVETEGRCRGSACGGNLQKICASGSTTGTLLWKYFCES